MMLRDAIAWTRRWFVRYESLWSIARKLAASNVATMEQVLCQITCRPELPSTRFFFQDEPHRNAWLAAILRLDGAMRRPCGSMALVRARTTRPSALGCGTAPSA